jgi:hypothetical protein
MCGAAAMSAEDDFRIRPGRIRSTKAQQARPFIAQALAAAQKAGGSVSRKGKIGPGNRSRFGSGQRASVQANRLITALARRRRQSARRPPRRVWRAARDPPRLEYQSKENAKHVLRAMNENARQGFWNGARPPIGYRIVAAEQRGAKTKKKLEIDPLHADTVRLIYRLFLEGDGTTGPMGVKAITCYLNERRIFTRDGGRWGLAQIHAILTRTTYIGEHRFNTRSHKDREKKPESEVAIMACPPLIDRKTFDAVQARLKARDPRMTPARVTSGPTLLTGICFCAKCGGAMTLRTGKGSAGGISLLYLLDEGPAGQDGLRGPLDPDGPARPTGREPSGNAPASARAVGNRPRQRPRSPPGACRASPRASCRAQQADHRNRPAAQPAL